MEKPVKSESWPFRNAPATSDTPVAFASETGEFQNAE
jgi:hypothetical protein